MIFYDKALAENASDLDAQYGKALTYFSQGDLDASLSWTQKVSGQNQTITSPGGCSVIFTYTNQNMIQLLFVWNGHTATILMSRISISRWRRLMRTSLLGNVP